eukprot:1159813-Pelagomonas_calceolata.AAC.14
MAEAEKEAVHERERADGLCRMLLDMQVEMRKREGERAQALSALVDEHVAPALRAAAFEKAVFGITGMPADRSKAEAKGSMAKLARGMRPGAAYSLHAPCKGSP